MNSIKKGMEPEKKVRAEGLLLKSSWIVHALMLPLVLFSSAKEKKASVPSTKGSVAEGEKLFKENCKLCHYPDKSDARIGPGLKDLFKNQELPATHRPVTEANVRKQILEGNPKAEPMPMPGFADKLKPQQVEKLIQYLKTL